MKLARLTGVAELAGLAPAGAGWRAAGLAGLLAIGGGCSRGGDEAPRPPTIACADAERGRLLLRQYPCGSCHAIPGVPGARGAVGPPLATMADQVYVAGVLPNTPANLVRWIVEPQAVLPGNAMPDLQVSEVQARDMAAYLYTLE